MDPTFVSVYISQHNERYRIGFGTLAAIKGGTFTIDAAEVARLDAKAAEVQAAGEQKQAEADAKAAEASRLQAEADAKAAEDATAAEAAPPAA